MNFTEFIYSKSDLLSTLTILSDGKTEAAHLLVSTKMKNFDKYCLKLSNFQENVKSTFGALRSDKEFVDVTVVCEDAFQIDCHKAILASSSPFFNEILTKLKQPRPLIYLRGMKEADLLAVLDFIYFGEVNVLKLL